MKPLLHRAAAVLATVAVTLAVVGVGAVYAVGRFLTLPVDDGAYVLLVMGSDQGPPRSGSVLDGRADGFHLVVVAPDHEHVTIVSFPRDSWVDVTRLGRTKINAALTLGPENAVATAEAVSGLEVDDWMVTGFDAFILAVSEFGGVDIDVEQSLHNLMDIPAGRRHLNGTQALAYVRDRKSRSGGDLDRAEAHARMLQALHAQAFAQQPDLGQLVGLVSNLQRHTYTSLSTDQLLRLAGLAMRIPPENVQRVRLDGRLGTAGAASVVYLTDAAYAVLADLRDDYVLGTAASSP